ncbi:hypothetical protein I4U23_018141 [Adineta vaga]|nr:hypothetical protein I4U23_018141 [Adineta vaga]
MMNTSSLTKLGTLFRWMIILCFLFFICYLYKNIRINAKAKFDTDISGYITLPHRLIINETNENIKALYYYNVNKERNSSYPFISGDTFRAMADHVLDEIRNDTLTSINYGDIIFVKGDSFYKFFFGPFRYIKKPFVLVSHNSDRSAPAEHRSRLKDHRILAWYASNPGLSNVEKLFPIPIGLANARWPSGNVNEFMYAFKNYRKPWINRSTLLYVNFSPDSHRVERSHALGMAKSFKNVQIVSGRVSVQTYLQQLGNAKFVLSPPGNGLDCHRTWEAMLMGAAPVIITSGLDPLFQQIPAVVLDNWTNLTEIYLSSFNFQSYDNVIPTVLYARYWREKLRKHRN